MIAAFYINYLYVQLSRLTTLLDEEVVGKLEAVESLSGTKALMEKIEELVRGSSAVYVLNLLNPSENNVHTKKFLRFLRRYLTSRECSIGEYRRISSVESPAEFKDHCRALWEFRKTSRIAHKLFSKSVADGPYLSFFLINRGVHYDVFFFDVLGSTPAPEALLISDKKVGQFAKQEFDRFWESLNDPPIFSQRRLDYQQLHDLAAKHGCTEESEYQLVLHPESWWHRLRCRIRGGR